MQVKLALKKILRRAYMLSLRHLIPRLSVWNGCIDVQSYGFITEYDVLRFSDCFPFVEGKHTQASVWRDWHCSGFLDEPVSDSTGLRSAGVNPVQLSGPPGDPHCTAHQDHPHVAHMGVTGGISVSVSPSHRCSLSPAFSQPLMPVF